ncbi:hypothetical protein NQ317_013991 [Molorchus minor]|uniref:RNase H type-1 domain-containing protein n=1 Tax=Molorchus minor TaxID=1323400 RepID=A0ABQ9JFJ5_9CUCU|nr:hypothetical protein NQ317_013991 [Molorchus minor]
MLQATTMEQNRLIDDIKSHSVLSMPSDRDERERIKDALQKADSCWFTDGSKTSEGTGTGVHSCNPRTRISVSLGRNATVFQAEVYAIELCVGRLEKMNPIRRTIKIFSDSQAALKDLFSYRCNSKTVWNCQKALNTLSLRNHVTLVWILGHSGQEGNEIADSLARKGAETTFIGPEPVLGISYNTAKMAVLNWSEGEILQYWQSLPGMDHSKAFIKYPKKPRSEMLLGLDRQKLKTLIGLYTGHCRLKHHMHRIGLVEDTQCRLCLEDDETADHILCACPAVERIRFSMFGRARLLPEDLDEISPNKVIGFIKRLNLLVPAKMNITLRKGSSVEEKPIHMNFNCTTFRWRFSKSDYNFGVEENTTLTTFYVYVYDFEAPLWIQISFSQYPKLNLQQFFITFSSMGFFRLPEIPSGIYANLGHNRIKSLVGEDIPDMRKDHMAPKFTHDKKFILEITDRNEWTKNNSRNDAEAITVKLKTHNSAIRETETAQHVLCYCETLDRKRQDIYGQPKLSPEDDITQPTGKLYKLIKGTQLLEWVTRLPGRKKKGPARCFLILLLVAAILWKVKQRYDMYRRRQRLFVEMEQMASRPFSQVLVELEFNNLRIQQSAPSPIALEPCYGNRAAVLTLLTRLPTCGEPYITNGQSTGLAIASALVSLGNPRKLSIDTIKSDIKGSKLRKVLSQHPDSERNKVGVKISGVSESEGSAATPYLDETTPIEEAEHGADVNFSRPGCRYPPPSAKNYPWGNMLVTQYPPARHTESPIFEDAEHDGGHSKPDCSLPTL